MPGAQRNRTRNLGLLSLAAIAPIWGYSWVRSRVVTSWTQSGEKPGVVVAPRTPGIAGDEIAIPPVID